MVACGVQVYIEKHRGKAQAFKTIGRGFAPRQRFVFFTRRRRRRLSIYQSYYGREEINNNMSEWCRGKAPAFKTIGRGFAPRQSLSFSHVDVGDAFQFINHIMAERRRDTAGRSGVGVRRWRSKPQVVGSRPVSALSFSHVDVGDAFHFINHISAVGLPPALCLFHTSTC